MRPRAVLLVLVGLLVALLAAAVAVVIWVPGLRGPGFALLSAVVAAVLSSSLGLYGVWLNLSHQTQRDRFDRLLEAYGKLLLAGDKVRAAATDLLLYPRGRPSPYISATGVTIGPLPPEARTWNPHHVSDALFDDAQQLEAEAEIFLEEGEDSEVLRAWAAVDKALGELPPALAAKDSRPLTDRRQDVIDAVETLRDVAHRRLKSLR